MINIDSKIYLVFMLLITLASCSRTLRSDPEFIEDYRTFTVEKLSNGKYFIGFKGTPLTTVEEARIEWDHKAKQVCGGVYQYLGTYDQENYSEVKGAEKNSDASSVSISCTTEIVGALGCIITGTSFIVGEFGKKEHPIINGTVSCNNSSTPEEDLANTSGHESIPYAAPDDCVWVRDSSTQKYELDCEDR